MGIFTTVAAGTRGNGCGWLALLSVLLASVPPSSFRGLRVNRALRATHSRREVNALIAHGRIMVNGIIVSSPDDRLYVGDKVQLDGNNVVWEEKDLESHRYIKYHKPAGIVCTTDRRVKGNIIDAFLHATKISDDTSNYNKQSHDDISAITRHPNHTRSSTSSSMRRVFPIGRLDAESTGLILLTSDGSIVNPLLRTGENKTKEYIVETCPQPTDKGIRELAKGVVITTLARRDGMDGIPVTARTLPCVVERHKGNALRFVIQEGRNRQIRRMCATLDLKVVALHRVAFAGVTLCGCDFIGDWDDLSESELISIGARKAPTREERRTPEERAKRKLKKSNKKRKLS